MTHANAATEGTGYRRVFARAAWLRRLVSILLFGYDGFISHAHADGRLYANSLWIALERLGLTVCFDRQDFHLGDPLRIKIRRTVRSSRHLILLDTPTARSSSYCGDEIAAAYARKRPIITVRHPGAVSHKWEHLPATKAGLLDGDIRLEEPVERFDRGDVPFESAAAIRDSITHATTRQRLRRLASSIACLIVLLGLAVLAARMASSALKALQWTLEDADASLEEGRAEVAAFLGSPLYYVSDVLYHDSTEELLEHAYSVVVKMQRLEVPSSDARASTSGRTMVAKTGRTFVAYAERKVLRCSPDLQSHEELFEFGIDNRGAYIAAVSESRLLVWKTQDCQQPFAVVRLSALGLDNRDAILGLHVQDGGSGLALVLWSQRRIVAVNVAADHVVEHRVLDSRLLPKRNQDQRFFDVAAAGPVVVFTAGDEDQDEPRLLCLTTAELDRSPLCREDAVQRFALNSSGRYLIESIYDSDVLYVWQVSLSGGFEAVGRRNLPIRSISGVDGGDAVAVLDDGGFVTLLDLPSLNVLGRQFTGQGCDQPRLGSVWRAEYEQRAPLDFDDGSPWLLDCPTILEGQRAASACQVSRLTAPLWRLSDSGPGGSRQLVYSVGPTRPETASLGGTPRSCQLSLADLSLPETTRLSAATFTADCRTAVIAVEDHTRSVLHVVDITRPRPWRAGGLYRRATRAVSGSVRALDIHELGSGWLTALVVTNGDRASLTVQRVPVTPRALRKWLEEDNHAIHSPVALVGRR